MVQGEPYVSTQELSAFETGLSEALFEQATACARSGDYGQAVMLYQRLLAKWPQEYTIRNNYAYILEKLDCHAEALEQYRLLFEAMPGYANGTLGYARMLEQGRNYTASVATLRHAVAVSPDNSRIMAGLGNALILAGDAEAALLWYGISLEISRQDRSTISNFLYALLMVSAVSSQVIARELGLIAAIPGLSVKMSQVARKLRNLTSEYISSTHRLFGQLPSTRMPHKGASFPNSCRRIRVGYVSADLYAHPVGYFLEGVIPCHDRERFEVFLLSAFPERDGLTQKLKQAAEHWVTLNQNDRQDALRQIRECCLDIAVDMAGHTGGNYLDLFGRGLAPIQVTWGGYPGTTGLDVMDYIIGDRVSLPLEDRAYYVEQPICLPHGYVCFVPPEDAPESGVLPAITSGSITFGSFNTVQKLNSSTLALWAAVLRALPESRIFLKSKGFDDPLVCSAFLDRFVSEGVGVERIELEGYSPRNGLLATYQKVDIALDPIPYQGGVTVLEALWMGVPTLVLKGVRPPFIRHGESHLANAGLADWIAVTKEEYVAKAIAWSSNLTGLSALRSNLRKQMAASPICDTAGFTRDLEAAYQQVWSGQADSRCPQTILPMS